jgi:S1-C subfamily serine protease
VTALGRTATASACLAMLLFAGHARAEQPGPAPGGAPVEKAQEPLPPHPSNGAEDRGPPCEAAFIEHVYKATKPSVVRITRPDGSLGTGFVFIDNKHIATALHVVDLGRELRVEFPNGKLQEAEVVGVDEDHDLAILELAQPTDAPVLVPRFNVSVGSPILAIGNPYGDLARFSDDLEGLLNFSVSAGIVSAKSDAYIQTDTVLSPGNSGGPMLTCDGKVIGVADRLLESRIGFGVPVAHLTKLAENLGTRRYHGRFVTRDAAIGITWQSDASSYLGAYVGGSIVGFDRIALTTRLGIAFAGKKETSDPIVDRSVTRVFGEVALGYRFLLLPYSFPTYLTVAGALFATFDRGSETRLSISPTNAGQLVAATNQIRGGGLEPMAQAILHLSSFEASYGFALDVGQPKYSTHRVLVGLFF